MAWSWSHTNEAYEAVRLNLDDLPPAVLQEIWAEWLATDTSENPPDDADYSGFSPFLYADAIERVADIPAADLADSIWEAASEAATCDNGGYSAWLCPHGCGPHCVPFDREGVTTDA